MLCVEADASAQSPAGPLSVVRPRPGPYSRSRPRRRLLPHPEPAQERVAVAAEPRAGRHAFEELDVSAAEHHVVHLERGAQALDHVLDAAPPLPAAPGLQPALADVVLVGP